MKLWSDLKNLKLTRWYRPRKIRVGRDVPDSKSHVSKTIAGRTKLGTTCRHFVLMGWAESIFWFTVVSLASFHHWLNKCVWFISHHYGLNRGGVEEICLGVWPPFYQSLKPAACIFICKAPPQSGVKLPAGITTCYIVKPHSLTGKTIWEFLVTPVLPYFCICGFLRCCCTLLFTYCTVVWNDPPLVL